MAYTTGGSPEAVAEAFVAAGLDDADRLDSLFHYGAVSAADAVDCEGNTLLHEAAAQGCLRAAKSVVKKAVFWHTPARRHFLNTRNAAGFTPLDLARAANADAVASWLLALGAADPLAPSPTLRGPPAMVERSKGASRPGTVPGRPLTSTMPMLGSAALGSTYGALFSPPMTSHRQRSGSPPLSFGTSSFRPGTSGGSLGATAPAALGTSPSRPTTTASASPPKPMPRRASPAFALLESYVLRTLVNSAGGSPVRRSPGTDVSPNTIRSALADVASAMEAGQALERDRRELVSQAEAAKQLATRAAASARGAVAADRLGEIEALKAQLGASQAAAKAAQEEAAQLRRQLQRAERDKARMEEQHREALANMESEMREMLRELETAALTKGYDCGYADGADAERDRAASLAAAAAAELDEMVRAAPAVTPRKGGSAGSEPWGRDAPDDVDDVISALLLDVERSDAALDDGSLTRAPAGFVVEEPSPSSGFVQLRPAPTGARAEGDDDSDDEESLEQLRARLKAAQAGAAAPATDEEDLHRQMLVATRDGLRPVSPEPSPQLRRMEADVL